MVRRGSTVRVRQRASILRRTARKWRFFVAAPDTVEHLSVREGVSDGLAIVIDGKTA
jgi:hypothetical protein